MHGARVIALRGNFDEALKLVRELCPAPPDRARQQRQPVPAGGPEDRGLRGARRARRARRALHPGRQRGQRHRLPQGLQGDGRLAAAVRLPGRGRRAAGARQAGREPGDGRERDPDRQPRALGGGDGGLHRPRAATSPRSPTPRSSTPTASWPPTRASSASRPAPPRSPACWRTASTAPSASSACSPATASRTRRPRCRQAGAVVPCEPDIARSKSRPGVASGQRLWPRPRLGHREAVAAWEAAARARPRVLGQPRAGVRRDGRGAGPAHGGRGRRDRPLRRPHRPADRARPPQPDRARLRGAAPAGRLRVHDPLGHPALRRARDERGGDRRRAGRGRLDLRARRRPAGRGDPARRPSGQRRGRAAGRLRALHGRARGALRAARRRSSACSWCPRRPCARRRRARRCRRGSRSPTRSSTSPTPRCSCSGSRRGDLGLVARGLGDRIHQPRRAHLYPRSWELVQNAKGLGALGATISGAGPTVLVWCDFESTGAVARAPGASSPTAGRRCYRVPFTATGAEVRSL